MSNESKSPQNNSFLHWAYDHLSHRPMVRGGIMAVLTMGLIALVANINFNEDIADFLPIEGQHKQAMTTYQQISGASNVVAIIKQKESPTPPQDTENQADETDLYAQMCQAADDMVNAVSESDTTHMVGQILWQVDAEAIDAVSDFCYANAPYFLSQSELNRIDSLLSQPGYAAQQMNHNRQMLMLPTAGYAAQSIQCDPLDLFGPTLSQMRSATSDMKCETFDGHIFSPDKTRCIVVFTSNYGASETANNATLSQLLNECAMSTMAQNPSTEITLVGGPVIAVGNAERIKKDSVLSIVISLVLIAVLLWGTLANWRNLMLIVLSIGWGWLFAMGGLTVCHSNVSMIVVGISSLILGIAVNYPLHYIAHLEHTPDRRRALGEIATPLIVGNITTVGAFLTLVPLNSVALRDLGIFAALLLVGTILFVLFMLPHMVAVRAKAASGTAANVETEGNSPSSSQRTNVVERMVDQLAHWQPDANRGVVIGVLILTPILAWLSLRTGFDTQMSNINYMTNEQRTELDYFEQTMTATGSESRLYVMSTGDTMDEALDEAQSMSEALKRLNVKSEVSSCAPYICSQAEQQRRLMRWREICNKHSDVLNNQLKRDAEAFGFRATAFAAFSQLVNDTTLTPQPIEYFAPLTETLYRSNLSLGKLAEDETNSRPAVMSIVTLPHDQIGTAQQILTAESERVGAQNTMVFGLDELNGTIASHLSEDFNYIGWACSAIVFCFLWLSMGSVELAALSFVPMAVSWLWIMGIMGLAGIDFNIVNIILATFIFGQGDDYTIFMTEGAIYEYAYRRRMLASYKHSIILSALIMFIGIGSLVVAEHPAMRSLGQVTVAGMASVVLMAYIFPPLIFRMIVMKNGEYRLRPITVGSMSRGLWVRILWGMGQVVATMAPNRRGWFGKVATRLTPGVRVAKLGAEGERENGQVLAIHGVQSPLAALVAWGLGCADSGQEIALVLSPDGTWRPTERVRRLWNIRDEGEQCQQEKQSVRHLTLGFANWISKSGELSVFDGDIEVHEGQEMGAPQLTTVLPVVRDRYRYKGTDVFRQVKRNLRDMAAGWAAGWTDAEAVLEPDGAMTLRGTDDKKDRDMGHGEGALVMALTHPNVNFKVETQSADLANMLQACADGLVNNIEVC